MGVRYILGDLFLQAMNRGIKNVTGSNQPTPNALINNIEARHPTPSHPRDFPNVLLFMESFIHTSYLWGKKILQIAISSPLCPGVWVWVGVGSAFSFY